MSVNETPWRAGGKVVSRVIDGHAVLVALGRNEATFLNPVGSALWSRLDGRTRASELARALAGAYGMPADEARDAVARFVGRLSELGLIEPADGSSGAPAASTASTASTDPMPFPETYDVPAVAPMESLQVMGGCTSNDAFCSIVASV